MGLSMESEEVWSCLELRSGFARLVADSSRPAVVTKYSLQRSRRRKTNMEVRTWRRHHAIAM